MEMIRSLVIVALLAVAAAPARSEERPKKKEIPYRRQTLVTVTIPKDQHFLVALDQGRPGSIVLPGTPAPAESPDARKEEAGETGVDPIVAHTARLDVTLMAEILEPLVLGPLAQRKFVVDMKWEEKRVDEDQVNEGALKMWSKAKWSSSGSLGFTYMNDMIQEPWGTRVMDEPGLKQERRLREKPILSANLVMVPTGVEGLSYGRIPYTEVDGATHAVVVFWARDLGPMSRCVRVSKENPKFEWTEKWFSDIATPSLEKP